MRRRARGMPRRQEPRTRAEPKTPRSRQRGDPAGAQQLTAKAKASTTRTHPVMRSASISASSRRILIGRRTDLVLWHHCTSGLTARGRSVRTSGWCSLECLRQCRQTCPWGPPERVTGDAEVGALIGIRSPACRGCLIGGTERSRACGLLPLGLRNDAIRSVVDRDVDQKWHVVSPAERRILARAPVYSRGFRLSGKRGRS